MWRDSEGAKTEVLERAPVDIGAAGLKKLLHARVAAAEHGSLSTQTVDQIIDGVLQEGRLPED